MRIQTAILVYDENARQFGRVCIPSVLTEGTDEVAPDVSVSIGRGYSLVRCLNSLVVLANLLPQCIVRHQRLDNRLRTKACNGETLNPTQESATTDLTVNVTCVQFHSFGWDFYLYPFLIMFH